LGFVDSYQQLINEVILNKQSHQRIKKVLLVNFSAETLPEDFVSNDEILIVSTTPNKNSANNSKTNVYLNRLDSDADYLFGFLRIILPIAYEFNPDLIYVYAGKDVTSKTTNVMKIFYLQRLIS